MGQACGCADRTDEQEFDVNRQKVQKGATLGNKHYSARDIYIICRMQAYRRGILARRRVQNLRYEMYSPGYHDNRGGSGEDYENVNVLVRTKTNFHV